jgi:hypothetical protein
VKPPNREVTFSLQANEGKRRVRIKSTKRKCSYFIKGASGLAFLLKSNSRRPRLRKTIKNKERKYFTKK